MEECVETGKVAPRARFHPWSKFSCVHSVAVTGPAFFSLQLSLQYSLSSHSISLAFFPVQSWYLEEMNVLESCQTWVWDLVLLFTSSVTLGKYVSSPKLQSSNLENGHSKNTCFLKVDGKWIKECSENQTWSVRLLRIGNDISFQGKGVHASIHLRARVVFSIIRPSSQEPCPLHSGVLQMFVEFGCVYQGRVSPKIMRNKWWNDWELYFLSLKKYTLLRKKKMQPSGKFLSQPNFLSQLTQTHAWVSTAVDDCRESLLMTSFRLLMTKPLSKMSSKLLKTSLKVLKLIHCNKKVINLAAWIYHQDKMLSTESPCCCLSVVSLPPSLPFPTESKERRNTSISQSGADLAATCLCQFQITEAHLTGQNVLSTCVFLNMHKNP